MKEINSELYQQAEKYIKEKKFDAAIAILEKLVLEEPYVNVIKYQLAKLYLKKKDKKDEGVKMLEYLSNDKGNIPATLLLGRYYSSINKKEEAFITFKKLFKTDKELYAVYEMGRLFLKDNNILEAKKCFEYVVSKRKDVYSLFELGKIYMDEKNYQVARDYLERALEIKFDNYTFFMLGKLEEEENNLEEAADIFYELLENNPNDVYSMFELGKIETLKGNIIKARNLFEKVLKIKKGNDIPTLYELGKLDEKEGYYKKAKERFNKVLELKPDDIFSKLELATLSVNVGDNKTASEIYNELINEHDFDLARLNYTNVLHMEGNISEAKKICEELLEQKDNIGAKLTLGKIYALEGENELAKKIFIDLINNYDEEYAYFELIYIYINEKRFEEAYELFKKISPRFKEYSIYLNVELYLEYNLGINLDPEWLDATYFGSQLKEYTYDKLFEHIIKHQDEDDPRKYYANFNDDIDFNELVSELLTKKAELKPSQRFLLEKYIIECDNPISMVDGEEIKHVAINVLPGSDKIISMYPIRLSEKKLTKENNKIFIKN